MFLLFSIMVISFLIAFIHIITKPVSIKTTLTPINRSRISCEIICCHLYQRIFESINLKKKFRLQIVALFTSASAAEKQLIDEIATLKAELEEIPMRQKYTAYVKVERKIVAAQAKLNETRKSSQTTKLIAQYGIPYGLQLFLSAVLFLITILYRYTPIVVFNGTQYDFIPFGAILRFPTGINGAVSVPFWIFVNNYVSRHAASYVK